MINRMLYKDWANAKLKDSTVMTKVCLALKFWTGQSHSGELKRLHRYCMGMLYEDNLDIRFYKHKNLLEIIKARLSIQTPTT